MVHHALGARASFIKSIPNDALSEKQIRYLQSGGNKQFADFMETYNLNSESPFVKYNTKAACYCRHQVPTNYLALVSLKHR